MDLDRIEQLVRLFVGSRAHELVVEADGWHVSLRQSAASPVAAPSPTLPPSIEETPAEPAQPTPPTVTITAPLVGIFRQGERPLEPGDQVRAGSEVGAIESMKIPSPVVAPMGGTVTEVLVEDGHPVEYGQPLVVLWPLPELAEEEEEEV